MNQENEEQAVETCSQRTCRFRATKKRPAGIIPNERLHTDISCFDVLKVLLESRTYPRIKSRFLNTVQQLKRNIRIDNALSDMPKRLQNVHAQLDNLRSQMDAARAEIGKPFPQEAELAQKSARLAELNALLDIDSRAPAQRQESEVLEKSERPSVLESLKTSCVCGTGKKLKHELAR